jgi:hypothetical protein
VVIANRGQPVTQLTAVPAAALLAVRGCAVKGNVGLCLQAMPLPAHARRTAEEIDAELVCERGAWD